MINQETIFIAISRAGVLRNLLHNNFMHLLSKHYRVVILSPLFDDPEFVSLFGSYDLEPLYERPLTPFTKKMEQVFKSLHKVLIYNPTVEMASKYGFLLRKDTRFKRLKNFAAQYFFGTFFNNNFWRMLVKKIDGMIYTCKKYDAMLEKYQPSLVFLSSIGGDDQVALLRNCKAKGIMSVGMAQSWDNQSKYGFREKVDKMVVWSDYMKDEALQFQCYDDNEIDVVGIPQFDHYVSRDIYSEHDFYKKYNLDPNKKTILFGSEGPAAPDDPYVVSLLKKNIQSGELKDFQVLVRPHFGYKTDIDRYNEVIDGEDVYIDTFRKSSKFKDGTSLTMETVENLIAQMKYSDVVMTSASTLVLDYAACEKQPLIYGFDKDKNAPYKDSIKRFYDTLWFREIFKFGLDNVIESEQELVSKIKEVCVNPQKDMSKREKMLNRLCYKIDGKSGERLFQSVDAFVKQHQTT